MYQTRVPPNSDIKFYLMSFIFYHEIWKKIIFLIDKGFKSITEVVIVKAFCLLTEGNVKRHIIIF